MVSEFLLSLMENPWLYFVFRIFYAIGDRCTHDDGPLGDGELENSPVSARRHGAKFDVQTGEVLSFPAIEINQFSYSSCGWDD